MATSAPTSNVASLHGGAEDGPAYRAPPHNTEIEAALLGAILTNNRAYERVSDFLRSEHFAEPVLGRIYAAAEKLIETGQVASPLTLKHYFEHDPALAEVGGSNYLFDLAASVVTVINAADYGRIIHDLHLRRELIGLGEEMVNDAYGQDLEMPASIQIEASEQRLYDLATTGETERGPGALKGTDRKSGAWGKGGSGRGVHGGSRTLKKKKTKN